jgi:hypothetical protein
MAVGRMGMGLTMGERRSVTRETAGRYRLADKKGKQRILDEFTQTTGYHRKYAIGLLSHWGKRQLRWIDGVPVKVVVGKPRKGKKRPGRRIYGEAVRKAVKQLWKFSDYMCGKRLAVFIRMHIQVLAAEPEFGIDEEVRQKLAGISAATIDRILAASHKAMKLKGRSHTKPGTWLKHQIPIRTFYDWDEQQPGFFELDTVAHDGGKASEEYCYTLTATDVASGWTELRALRNRAHSWVKQELQQIREDLPFPLWGIDSDNGGEFINHQLWNYCTEEQIQFTRGRAYRKNDNCFVEQKNDTAVRRTVGYYRFDTEAEYQALRQVYRYLCPLLNFFYPSMKLIQKSREGARVRKRYDDPKPPYLRVLESSKVKEQVKGKLRRMVKQVHVVKQKRLLDEAVDTLMRLYEEKKQQPLAMELTP